MPGEGDQQDWCFLSQQRTGFDSLAAYFQRDQGHGKRGLSEELTDNTVMLSVLTRTVTAWTRAGGTIRWFRGLVGGAGCRVRVIGMIVIGVRVVAMIMGTAAARRDRARGILGMCERMLVRMRMKMRSTEVDVDMRMERKTSRHRQNVGGRRKNRDRTDGWYHLCCLTNLG